MPTLNWVLFGDSNRNYRRRICRCSSQCYTLIGGGVLGLAAIGYLISLYLQPVAIANPDITSKSSSNNEVLMGDYSRARSDFHLILPSLSLVYRCWILSVLTIYCKDYLICGRRGCDCFLAMFTLGIAIGSIICKNLLWKG